MNIPHGPAELHSRTDLQQFELGRIILENDSWNLYQIRSLIITNPDLERNHALQYTMHMSKIDAHMSYLGAVLMQRNNDAQNTWQVYTELRLDNKRRSTPFKLGTVLMRPLTGSGYAPQPFAITMSRLTGDIRKYMHDHQQVSIHECLQHLLFLTLIQNTDDWQRYVESGGIKRGVVGSER